MPTGYPRFLLCCALLPCLLRAEPALAPAQDARVAPEQLRQDLAVLESAIRNNHPDLSHSVDETQLARARADLDFDTPLTRDEAWRKFATVNPVLADGHLFVGYADWRADVAAHLESGGGFFPFEVQVTPGAEVYIRAQLGGEETPLAGARLQQPIQQVTAILGGHPGKVGFDLAFEARTLEW